MDFDIRMLLGESLQTLPGKRDAARMLLATYRDAKMHRNLIRFNPQSLRILTTAMAVPAVATIGSKTSPRSTAQSTGNLL